MTLGEFDSVDPAELRRLLIEAREEIDALRDELEAALAELHDTRTRLNDVVRERSIEQAVTRRHPSVGLSDPCPPFGIGRPDLRLIGGTG